jgi:hypothetical protein
MGGDWLELGKAVGNPLLVDLRFDLVIRPDARLDRVNRGKVEWIIAGVLKPVRLQKAQ